MSVGLSVHPSPNRGASQVDNASVAKHCWFKVFPVTQGRLCNHTVPQSDRQVCFQEVCSLMNLQYQQQLQFELCATLMHLAILPKTYISTSFL